MIRNERIRAAFAATAAWAIIAAPSFAQVTAGTNGDCVNNGQAGSPFPAGSGSVTITPLGGQVSGAGATLFADFFTFAASTNDAIDVDNDGRRGFDGAQTDQLSTQWPINGTITTHWMFQYRSVGSVNGFNEFVGNQICGARSVNKPSELGIFNQFRYSSLANDQWGGPFPANNASGTPTESCEVEFAFLDVPSKWAVRQPGAPKWSRAPLQPGYGLNPVVSSTGFVSNLQTLSRECGTCTGGVRNGEPCTVGVNEANQCPSGTCVTSSVIASLNQETATADEDTIFDSVAAWVPVSYISNRGTGLQNVKYSDMQYAFVTGRMPTGENLAVGTRSVGSGTRNAIMNSSGVDTSWGRGENTGNEFATTATSLGTGHQVSNTEGSGIMELGVQQSRLAVGYTGLAGPSRAIADAISGNYEVLNVCKNVVPRLCSGSGEICTTVKDCPGGETCDPIKRCSLNFQLCEVNADCLPSGGTCDTETACNCDPQACANGVDGRNAATPNNGYVRPAFNTVLDNCDQCCGYQIGGNGSFVLRGNRDANRDPGMKCTGAGGEDCLVDSECPIAQTCTLNKTYCMNSCVGGTSAGKVCGSNSDCPGGGSCAVGNENSTCTTKADCPAGPGGTCEEKKRCTAPTTGGSFKFCRTLADCPVGDTACELEKDLKWVPDAKLDNQAVADYLNNIEDSTSLFTGGVVRNCKYTPTACVADAVCLAEIFPQLCVDYTGLPGGLGLQCSITGNACTTVGVDLIACPDQTGLNVPQFCTPGATPRRCAFDRGTVCTTDANCPDTLENICQPINLSGEFNLPGQLLATTFFLPNGIDCQQTLESGMMFEGAPGLVQALQDFARANFTPNTPAFGSVNPTTGGKAPVRTVLSAPNFYSDGQASSYVYWNGTDPGGVTGYQTLASGQNLARRNMIQGDFNRDCTRTIADAGELVAAYTGPRAWQKTLIAENPGGGCLGAAGFGSQTVGGSRDIAIPEVVGDFDGDGNLTKEDLRYFADGLAMITLTPSHCSVTVATPCAFDSQCPASEACLHDRRLDRKAGAIAIDTAIDAGPCRGNTGVCLGSPATACTVDGDCGANGPCVCFPWAEKDEIKACTGAARVCCRTNADCPGIETCTVNLPAGDTCRNLIVPATSLGVDPTFLKPLYVNDAVRPFLKTGKPYQLGDFRGDVAGGRDQVCVNTKCSITGFTCVLDADCPRTRPIPGAEPQGWDGTVDDKDINYCCRAQGDWTTLNDAVFMDLSCDMDGNGTVNLADLTELVQVILGTTPGDTNLDGAVDDADRAIVFANLADACNDTLTCGWEQGDFNWDGVVDELDLVIAGVPPAVTTAGDDVCVGGGNAGNPCSVNSDCPGGFCRLKNRYITVQIPATATANGIKVTLANLDADSVLTPATYNGTDRWVGLPSSPISDGAGYPTFIAAKTQCTFVSTDWSSVGRLLIYGDVIVPTSTYDAYNCASPTNCSTALRIGTAKFGDVIAPVNTVNFSDAFSIVATLQGAPTRPQKTRSDLVAAVLNPSNANAVNFSDVGACVSALQLKKFREAVTAPPVICP